MTDQSQSCPWENYLVFADPRNNNRLGGQFIMSVSPTARVEKSDRQSATTRHIVQQSGSISPNNIGLEHLEGLRKATPGGFFCMSFIGFDPLAHECFLVRALHGQKGSAGTPEYVLTLSISLSYGWHSFKLCWGLLSLSDLPSPFLAP
jgi:hypothetical protein